MRIGSGYDVHRFANGKKLVLGGVEIPFIHGLDGHSDADVLLHAIMDALLGAAALGDIGTHFPDTDEKYKGVSSRILLREVALLLQVSGFVPVNIDSTIIAEAPKMQEYIDEMRKNIASDLGLDISCVSVKATTEEGLGFTGRREGMAATAVALVEQE